MAQECSLVSCGNNSDRLDFALPLCARDRKILQDRARKFIGEQIAKENEKAGDNYVCPRLPHPAGMESCDYCSGVQDGFYLAAVIARGK